MLLSAQRTKTRAYRSSSHLFVNQFEKMDRSKSNTSGANHKDIICGQSFEPVDILQEIGRLRNTPVDIVKSKQEDAHELLCQLLSELHDEICSILYNTPTVKAGRSLALLSSSQTHRFTLSRRTGNQCRSDHSDGTQRRGEIGRLAPGWEKKSHACSPNGTNTSLTITPIRQSDCNICCFPF